MTTQQDTGDDVATCRGCGCTEDAGCAGGCTWVPDPLMMGDLCSTCLPDDLMSVLLELFQERARQDELWGNQNHPDGTGQPGDEHVRDVAQQMCRHADAAGRVTWRHILMEEIAEAFAETDPRRIRTELGQAAAVCIAWIQALDRRAG